MKWNRKINEWYDRQGEARFHIMIGLILLCYGVGWIIKPGDSSFGIGLFIFVGAIIRMSYVISMDSRNNPY